jgi:hypothetical protein
MTINNTLSNITGLDSEIFIIIFGGLIYYFQYLCNQKSVFLNIITTAFVLGIFDVFIKKIFLTNIDNEYYQIVINNILTIVIIDFLFYFIRGKDDEVRDINNYFNLAFACLFYETIIFKLYDYNNLCNPKLRSITKTIMRLATIHLLSNYLNGKPYDEIWFNFSFAQLFNFSLFDTVFTE